MLFFGFFKFLFHSQYLEYYRHWANSIDRENHMQQRSEACSIKLEINNGHVYVHTEIPLRVPALKLSG